MGPRVRGEGIILYHNSDANMHCIAVLYINITSNLCDAMC